MMENNIVKANLFKELENHGRTCIQRMEFVWEQLYGNKPSIIKDRYEQIELHVKKLFDEMVEEEEGSLEEHRKQLVELIACKQSLQEELQVTIEVPFEVDLNKPNLNKQLRKLTEALKKYEAMRLERLQELVSLKNIEEKLCDILGEEPKYVSIATVPSEKLLAEIRECIKSLEAEKIERSSICHSLISEIEELICDLELDDTDPNDIALLSRDENVALSKARITDLQEWKSRLISSKDKQMSEIAGLKQKVSLLWDLLDISAEERENILSQTVKVCGLRVIDVWRRELERCETLKAVNIHKVISRLREVIKGLWNDCHLSEDERRSFIYFHSENYSESLLREHEEEQQRLRQYYDERKAIFTIAKKWFALWDKMIVLERQASSNTNRYANRGGQLLKEERERKAVQKELPKVEASLEKMIADIEEKTQKPFTYDGRPLLEKIAELWEERRREKENEKEVRKTQSRGVTPLKLNNGVATPHSSVQKRGKVLSALENASARKLTPARRELKMPVSAKKPVSRRSRSHDPSNRCRDVQTNGESADHTKSDASVGSYTGFQDYLEQACKKGLSLRSSVSPPSTPSKRNDEHIIVKNISPPLFKTPATVPKPRKKFATSKLLRPMIY